MNRSCLIGTLVLAAIMLVWLASCPDTGRGLARAQSGPNQVQALPPPSNPSSGPGHTLVRDVLLLVVLLVAGIAMILVIAQLQRRRRRAFTEAQKRRKEDLRAPRRTGKPSA